MKRIAIASLFTLMSIFVSSGHTADLDKLSRKLFIDIEAELVKIEGSEGASTASGEIAVARQWLDEGKLFLAKGSLEKAAVIAERLPSQLELIRAVIAAGIVVSKAQKMEGDIQRYSEELRTLKTRYDRLILMYHGASATHAFPAKKEGAE